MGTPSPDNPQRPRWVILLVGSVVALSLAVGGLVVMIALPIYRTYQYEPSGEINYEVDIPPSFASVPPEMGLRGWRDGEREIWIGSLDYADQGLERALFQSGRQCLAFRDGFLETVPVEQGYPVRAGSVSESRFTLGLYNHHRCDFEFDLDVSPGEPIRELIALLQSHDGDRLVVCTWPTRDTGGKAGCQAVLDSWRWIE